MRVFLARQWFLLALAAGGALALWEPALFGWADHANLRLTVAVALFLMAWTMPGRSLARAAARPWAAAWAMAISYGLLPPLAWLAGRLLAPDYAVGLVIIASVPCTLASAVLWTRRARGDEAAALLVTLATTATSWLVTPLWLVALTGTAVELDAAAMMLDLVRSLVLPVALGQACQAAGPLARLAARYRTPLSAVSQLLILVILLKALAGVGVKLHEGAPGIGVAPVLGVAAACVVVHLAALAFGLWSGRAIGLGRGERAAVAFSCSQKTLPVAMLLFEGYFQAAYPLAVLPLAFYHFGQLLVDTFVADALAPRPVG
jgi:sodium/bile acid cotransporter 7